MKTALLAALLLASLSLFGQESDHQFQSVAQPQAQPSSGQAPSQEYVPPPMLKAPQQGHPLDPNDVMILTGKADQAPSHGYEGAYYYGSPYNASLYGNQQFTSYNPGRATQVGRFNGFTFQNGPFFGGRLFGPSRPFTFVHF